MGRPISRSVTLSKHPNSTMADQFGRPQFDRTIDLADIYMKIKAPAGLVSTAFACTSDTLKTFKVTNSLRLTASSDLYFPGCSHCDAFRCRPNQTQPNF
jgi:hypothetical protein